jgi:allantoin racemase
MRIFWQSFVDAQTSAPYMARLARYLSNIAASGTSVDVHGVTPSDRDFGRLTELRCSIRAIDNGIEAERAGYDAVVIGHFQDPGLYELRATLDIPVIGVGEATMFAAAQLGRRLGLVTLDPAFEVWHHEQAERYGLGARISHVAGLAFRPEDFSAAFEGDEDARSRLLGRFRECAQPMVEAGADVIIPAGVLPGLLVASERSFCIGHAPVVNCASIGLKSAEMWVQLRGLDGIGPSRGPAFARAPERAKADFQAMLKPDATAFSSAGERE